MDTPNSPPPESPPSPSKEEADLPPSPASIPLTSPSRTYPKRLIPHTLSSTYPHGHISGHPRSPSAQAAFEARRAEILRTMNAREIEKAYEVTAARINEVLADSEAKTRDVEAGIEKLRMEREMERRVWGKLRGMRDG